MRARRRGAPPGRPWTAIEPNSRNPYIWLHQERMRRAGLDEHHFRAGEFETGVGAHGLRVRRASTAFVVPGAFVRPAARRAAGAALERVRWLGGSVVYRLEPA